MELDIEVVRKNLEKLASYNKAQDKKQLRNLLLLFVILASLVSGGFYFLNHPGEPILNGLTYLLLGLVALCFLGIVWNVLVFNHTYPKRFVEIAEEDTVRFFVDLLGMAEEDPESFLAIACEQKDNGKWETTDTVDVLLRSNALRGIELNPVKEIKSWLNYYNLSSNQRWR
ncbi:MAG: hypothetical protein D8H99_56525 [Streptococcus sp.]|nr:MAG: hypothetical protein D8H99_56525 [Streptococcus sp.]